MCTTTQRALPLKYKYKYESTHGYEDQYDYRSKYENGYTYKVCTVT